MGEEWRAVPGYEGLYEVSDIGRVRGLRHGRFIAANRVPNGYLLFHLYSGGRRRVWSGHALVMAAFVGPRPQGMHVCHENGRVGDNRLANLRYDTPAGNNADKRRHGTYLFGDNASYRKLTTDAVAEIRVRRGEPQQALAEEFGCTFSNVSAIQLRKSWRHVP